ncbi:hypothetical protein PCASD_19795 [Puccinia coronata f. sp. avenae]|uniref:Uncharacterized protein n=1 Tax=Puccinia coronata f. sp. avenae TaxID=200324 RepID=A0A2N5SBR6_9BASI|nr:hypothetical protein PCASD_22878 [Puccinia coronata f. sp. avenae]PLW30255.1 hypothetical protein PCASD_19795 [Puccinia coronata f. sp. avenae]
MTPSFVFGEMVTYELMTATRGGGGHEVTTLQDMPEIPFVIRVHPPPIGYKIATQSIFLSDTTFTIR